MSRRTFLLVMLLLISLMVTAVPSYAGPSYSWHAFYGSQLGFSNGYATTVDSGGNTYVTGMSQVTWNGPAGQDPLNAFVGYAPLVGGSPSSVFLLKLDQDGVYQWHTFFGPSSEGRGIACDSSGNVYVAYNGPALSGIGFTVAKFDPAGTESWNLTLGGNGSAYAAALALDSSGNSYVTGHSAQTWNGPGAEPPLLTGSGGSMFVAKVDAAGAYQWHSFYGPAIGRYDGSGAGIAVDSSDKIYIAGISYGAWNGPGALPPVAAFSAAGFAGDDPYSAFVLKLDAAGAYNWHTFFSSTEPGKGSYASGIAIDGSNGVYVVGSSLASWGSPVSLYPGFFTIKLGADGTYKWHGFYGDADTYVQGITAEKDKNRVYIAGWSLASWNGPQGQAPGNPFAGTPVLGHSNAFMMKLLGDSTYRWHIFWGSENSFTNAYALSVSSRGRVVTTGSTGASWSGPAGEPPLAPFTYGAGDFFAMKLRAVLPTVTTTAPVVTKNSAATGGNVTNDGGALVTARGVCWGTNPSPSLLSGACTLNGSDAGAFVSAVTGLGNATYHVRAYATNEIGTSYGSDLTFTIAATCSSITVSYGGPLSVIPSVSFSQSFNQSGAVSPSYTLSSGPLPSGLSLSAAGLVSGTTTQCGTFPVIVTVAAADACTGNTSAVFTVSCNSVTVSSSGSGKGTLGSTSAGLACSGSSCTGSFATSQDITVVAYPASGSSFAGWTGCGSPAGNSCTQSISAAGMSITANFAPASVTQHPVTVNATGDGSGTVTSTVGGVNFHYNNSSGTLLNLNQGVEVTFVAKADAGSRVVWSVNCSNEGIYEAPLTTATCTLFNLSNPQTVTATFIPFVPASDYELSLAIAGEGRIVNDTGTINWTGKTGTGTYPSGMYEALWAVGEPGYVFSVWTGDCAMVGGINCTFHMNMPRSITATFVQSDLTYFLTAAVASSNSSSGTVTSNNVGTDCSSGTVCTTPLLPVNTMVEINALPDPYSKFTGCSSGSYNAIADSFNTNPCRALLYMNRGMTVNFTRTNEIKRMADGTLYSLLQSAYGQTDHNTAEELRVQARTFNENVVLSAAGTGSLAVNGGYNASFDARTWATDYSIIHGSLTIGAGPVSLSYISIE